MGFLRFILLDSFSGLKLSKKDQMKTIVVAHYKEDLSWIDLYLNQFNHVVYTKADPLATNNIPVNKGNEASVYFRYIIDHYDKLPDVVAFIHGHQKAYNMKLPDDMALALRSLRWGLYDYMPLQTALKMALSYRISTDQAQSKSTPIQTTFNYNMWMKLFQQELGAAPILTQFYCCASFAVTRKTIHRYPKAFYENAYNYVMTIPEEILGLTGGMLEGIWHVIFGQPHIVQSFTMCELFHCRNGSTSTLIDCMTEKCDD